MVILNLKLDNIYSFNDFEINFTYKKKIVGNPLGEENLIGFPNFRYKKVNIITGSNATGKTTLGKAIMAILNFIGKKEIGHVLNTINIKDKLSYFCVDYYLGDGFARRIEATINPNASTNEDVLLKVFAVKLEKNDSYESYLLKLETATFSTDMDDICNTNVGWAFKFPFDTDVVTYAFPEQYYDEYEAILNKVITTLDPAIEKVQKSKEIDNCFNIFFKNGMQTLPIENNRSTRDMPRLSSGTKYAFNLAFVYLAVKEKLHGFYYVDEQFSYVNDDIEKTFISLLASMIGLNEQIIFTTHNTDVLDLYLPIHAYGFMKKEDLKISYLNASEVEKKNNVSIKNDYENDRFNVAPNLDKVYSLGELN